MVDSLKESILDLGSSFGITDENFKTITASAEAFTAALVTQKIATQASTAAAYGEAVAKRIQAIASKESGISGLSAMFGNLTGSISAFSSSFYKTLTTGVAGIKRIWNCYRNTWCCIRKSSFSYPELLLQLLLLLMV